MSVFVVFFSRVSVRALRVLEDRLADIEALGDEDARDELQEMVDKVCSSQKVFMPKRPKFDNHFP